jgi:putative two-component system response regulator
VNNTFGRSGPLLLIIDDDAMNTEIMEAYFELADYRTIKAHSGKQGIQMALQHAPDLILVDVRLQDISGYEVCAALRHDERTRHRTIVMMTALANQEDEQLAQQAGADGFILKTFHNDVFINSIGEWLTGQA